MKYQEWLEECLELSQRSVVTFDSLSCDEKKVVPAEFIRRALLEAQTNGVSKLFGLRIQNYRFSGALNLENFTISFPLFIEHCEFDDGLFITGLSARTISLCGCLLKQGMDIRTSYIQGHLLLRDGFVSHGPVLARDVNISATVDVSSASFLYDRTQKTPFENDAGGECFGFSRSKAAALYWRRRNQSEFHLGQKPKGTVNLRDVEVRSFQHDLSKDDWREAWPEKGALILEGFVYKNFADCDVARAFEWLAIQEKVAASSYAALATAYKVMHSYGKVEDVLAEAKRAQIAAMSQPIRRIFNKAVFSMVGYGKRPEQALGIFVLIFLLHISAIHFAHCFGLFQPTTNDFLLEPCFLGPADPCAKDISGWNVIHTDTGKTRYLPPVYPQFNSVAYALESFMPIFQFEQASYLGANPFILEDFVFFIISSGLFVGGVFFGGITGLISPKTPE